MFSVCYLLVFLKYYLSIYCVLGFVLSIGDNGFFFCFRIFRIVGKGDSEGVCNGCLVDYN